MLHEITISQIKCVFFQMIKMENCNGKVKLNSNY